MPTSPLTRRNLLATTASIPVVLGASSCGYLLYPQRRGSTGGSIDIPVLIVDLLWFLPGLLPGAICLIVDFTTGCIFQGGGADAKPVGGANEESAIATVEVDGVIVASGHVTPDRKATLSWSQKVDGDALKARGRLVLRHTSGDAKAEANVRDLIA